MPKNSKFNSIEAKVNTGRTMKIVEVLTDNQISRRRQETFQRITPKYLAKLIADQAKDETIFDLFSENKSPKFAN